MQVSRDMLLRIGGGLAIVLVLYFLLKSTNKSNDRADYDGNYASARFERYAPYPEDEDEYDASMETEDVEEAEYEEEEAPEDVEEETYAEYPEEQTYAEYPEEESYTEYPEEESYTEYPEGESYTEYPEYTEGMEPMMMEDQYEMPQDAEEEEMEEEEDMEEEDSEEDSEEEEDDSEGMADYGTMMYDDATPVQGFNAYEEFTVLQSTLDDGLANGRFATPF